MTAVTINEYYSEGNERARELSQVCFICLSKLLVKKAHFNFRLELLTLIITRLHKNCPDHLVVIACESLKQLFKEDVTGEHSRDAVKLVMRFVKNVQFKVRPELIETLLLLRLQNELPKSVALEGPKLSKKQRVHRSRSVRKVMKKEKEIEMDMKEAEATADRNERLQLQKQTLEFIFMIYFRILKNARESPLVSATLQGLAQYSHLINIDFFDDLSRLLQEISHDKILKAQKSQENVENALLDALNCTLAALKIVNVQHEHDKAILTDLHAFSRDVYSIVLLIPTLSFPDPCVNLLIKVLRLVFTRQRGLDSGSQRVAAFSKRLLILALSGLEPASVAQCLKLVQEWFIQFPKIKSLLDPDACLGSGTYLPLISDPDLCNIWTTNLYELHAFLHYPDTSVKLIAKEIFKEFVNFVQD